MTILEFLRANYLLTRTSTASSRETYICIVRSFERWMLATGHSAAVTDIDPLVLGCYFAWLRDRERSPNTVAAHYRVLRAVLTEARRNRLSRIRVRHIPRPRRMATLPKAWTKAEWAAIMAAASRLTGHVGPWPRAAWFEAIIRVVYGTGWRISDIMVIKMEAVSLSNAWIVAPESKHPRERFARVSPKCVEAIRRIWGPRDFLFGDWPADRWGRQWPVLNDSLGEIIEAAGIRDIGRWHAIRKTAATLICEEHGLEAARMFLGHSGYAVTLGHYIDPRANRTHIMPPDEDAA